MQANNVVEMDGQYFQRRKAPDGKNVMVEVIPLRDVLEERLKGACV